jgi:MFS family permease
VPLLVELPAAGVLVTGILAGVTLGAGTLVAGLQRRLGPWTAVVGTVLGAAGFGAAAAFAATAALPWLVAASLLLGSGGGLCLAAGLTLTNRLAAPTRRGALASFFLACAYVGFAAPYLVAAAAAATSVVLPLAVAGGLTVLLVLRLLPVARRGES